MESQAKRRVVFYLVLVTAFAVLAFVLKVGAFTAMWGPAAAAVVTSLVTRRSLKEIGWRPWPVKYLVAAWLIPVVTGFAAYGIVWAAGLGSVPNPVFLQRARITVNMPTQSNWQVIAYSFFYITVPALLPNALAAIGEEIGWRGLLVPELSKFLTFWQTAIVSGAIWSAWHLPMILNGSYGTTGTPRWYQITCFIAMVLSTAVVSAWLRLKSGSIWPVTIMHATHNGAIQAFFDRITRDTGQTHYFTGEFGIMLLPFLFAVAWWCLAHAKGLARETESEVSGRKWQPDAAGA